MQIHLGEQLFSKRKGFHVFMQIAIYTLFINTALFGLVCLVLNPLCASVDGICKAKWKSAKCV